MSLKMTKKRNAWPILGLLFSITLFVVGCGGQPVPTGMPIEPTITPAATEPVLEESKPVEADDTLRILYWQAPTMLNPHLSTAFKDLDLSRISYEPLASFDKDGQLIPFLAAEIPSLENGGVAADGKSVTWKLKPEVKWSDGEAFSADDVLFTYEFVNNPEVGAPTVGNYATIERLEVIDEFTIKLHFKDVNPAWAIPFVGRWGMILPRHIFEEYSNATSHDAPANLAPVGTGPYRLVEYNTEMLLVGEDAGNMVKMRYEANPFFRDLEQLGFREVEVQGGGDAATAMTAVLVEGAVDYAWNLQVDSESLLDVEKSGQGAVISIPSPHVERLMLNRTDPNRETETGERSTLQFAHPFFSDKKVRQAFAHAIDREAIAALYGNSATLTTNLLVAPPTYNSPNTADLYQFDLARAADLLDQAGWVDSNGDGVRDKDGIEMQVVFQTTLNPIRQETQQMIKEALESIGVAVELKVFDASIFFNNEPDNPHNTRHFQADMQEFYTGNQSPDPGSYMQWWTCDQIPQEANNWAGNNWARWCDETYEALYQQAATELEPEKRRELFIQMNDLLIEEVVHIPLVNRTPPSGVSNTLQGVELTPWDSDLWNIKEWRRKK